MKKKFFLYLFLFFVSSFELNCWYINHVINDTDETVTIAVCKGGEYLQCSTLCGKSGAFMRFKFPTYKENEKEGNVKIYTRDKVFVFSEKENEQYIYGIYFKDNTQDDSVCLCDPFKIRTNGDLIIKKNRREGIKFSIQWRD